MTTSQLAFWLVFFLTLFAGTLGPRRSWAQRPLSDDEGLSIVSWSNADQLVGKTGIITGKIVDVGRAGRVNFLNFDAKRRDVFKIVIFQERLSEFPGSLTELYHDQLVAVRGRITLYKDVPQIEVSSPGQIQVVNRLPKSRIVEPRKRKLSKRIRVATFNVRNLFDAVDNPYFADESTTAKPRKEMERLAHTINAIDADAIALQEVESRGYLQRFNDVFLGDMAYEVVHYAGNDQRGSGLAVLTRIPVGQVTSHRHRRFRNPQGNICRFSRDLLCVEMLHPFAQPFEIWVTHLKSKRGGAEETEPQRMAEALEIRRLFAEKIERDPKARILLMGDFNDTRHSRPIQNLLADRRLVGLFSELPADAITYNLPPYQEMIDFIFASSQARNGYIPSSYRIIDQSLDQSGSDHNPVIAEFEFSG